MRSQGEVNGPALLDLSTEEIRDELGLTLGKRKALQRAIASLAIVAEAPQEVVAVGGNPPAEALLERQRRQRQLAGPQPATFAFGPASPSSPADGGVFRFGQRTDRTVAPATTATVPGVAELDALVTRVAGSTGAAGTAQALRTCLAGLEGRPARAPSAAVLGAVSTPDFSTALAGHVQPGTALAGFAMVCREWWTAARALPVYYAPWDAEYRLWRAAGSQPWPDFMNDALEWQLASYLRRLPELEPDLTLISPVLIERARQYNVHLNARYAQGDHSEEGLVQLPDLENMYEEEAQQVHDLWYPSDGNDHPKGAHRGRLFRKNNLSNISDSAYRRLARRGGVLRFSGVLYAAARVALRNFLETVLGCVRVYVEQTCGKRTVHSVDVACALQLHGRDCSPTETSGASAQDGFFDRKPNEASIEEDDLSRPLPQQQVLLYLCCFGSVIAESIYSYFIISKSADVLLRRAAEGFLTQVFATANEATPLDGLTPELQTKAFEASARLITDGMFLHAHCCGPLGWVLDEASIAQYSKLNAPDFPRSENEIDSIDSERSTTTMYSADYSTEWIPRPLSSDDDDDDGAYDSDDVDAESDSGTEDEDVLEQLQGQEYDYMYDLGFETYNSDEEEESCKQFCSMVSDDTRAYFGASSAVSGCTELTSRLASFAAGRRDKDVVKLHDNERWASEERLEDLCAGFSAVPKTGRIPF